MDTMQISREWMNRPMDQRFLTMQELHAHNVDKRQRSLERGVALDHMLLAPAEGDMILGDPETKKGASLTHWAFGQLCTRVGAPAGYLRSLPAELAAIPLQWSMEQDRVDSKLLLRKNGHWTVDAVTSDTYGRIYDSELTEAIIKHIDLDTWKVPSASYASSNPKRATTLYASDRDVFVALVDDAHPIEVPGNNGSETLFRGFIARNSEVGAATLEIVLFLYRYICDNRIIWGGREVKSLKIRHTSGGPMRFVREAQPALKGYLEARTDSVVDGILQAQRKEVGKTETDVTSWLQKRGFTKPQAKAAALRASETFSNPRTVWALTNALTDNAHDIQYGDERLDFERKAGRILDMEVA